MDLNKLTKQAKKFVDQHGGTQELVKEAKDLKNIASSKGSDQDKLKQAASDVKDYLHTSPQGPAHQHSEHHPQAAEHQPAASAEPVAEQPAEPAEG